MEKSESELMYRPISPMYGGSSKTFNLENIIGDRNPEDNPTFINPTGGQK